MKDRLMRKMVHMLIGVAIFLSLNLLGKWVVESVLCIGLLAGIFLQDLKIKGRKIPLVDYLLEELGDPNEAIPGLGAMQYFVGLLLAISFIDNPYKINAAVAILAFGDGVASLVKGKIRWPHNKNKTLEGSSAFFLVSALASYLYAGEIGVLVAFLATIVESIHLRGISDNISIPVAVVILFKLM